MGFGRPLHFLAPKLERTARSRLELARRQSRPSRSVEGETEFWLANWGRVPREAMGARSRAERKDSEACWKEASFHARPSPVRHVKLQTPSPAARLTGTGPISGAQACSSQNAQCPRSSLGGSEYPLAARSVL